MSGLEELLLALAAQISGTGLRLYRQKVAWRPQVEKSPHEIVVLDELAEPGPLLIQHDEAPDDEPKADKGKCLQQDLQRWRGGESHGERKRRQ